MNTLRKIFFSAMFFLMAVSSCAYDVQIDGICYDLWITKKTASVASGIKYSGHVTIPSYIDYDGYRYDVTAVSESAFASCRDLVSVVLPNSIKDIGPGAFSHC
ncbi:MAG: hypothetical protein ACI4B5_08995, partial [Bacteroidaceae bacterium]